MNSKRVYILGAGSSIGHSQGNFPSIADFFSIAKKLKIDSEFGKLQKYGYDIYGVDIFENRTDIEDLYTQLEIDIERKPEAELLAIRSQLLNLIKKILVCLEKNLPNHIGEYNKFINMDHPILQKEDTIITFNWDLLLDNLLGRAQNIKNSSVPSNVNENHRQYDNFFESLSIYREIFRSDNIPPPLDEEYSVEQGYYLKMHGSIDWTYCNNQGCGSFQKVFPIMDPLKTYICRECFEPLETLLIPPLLNKNYRKYPMIRKIWNLAAHEIHAATEIIIWGYSLPSTDFYSKWLIRQANKNALKKIILINPKVTENEFINTFQELFKKNLDWKNYRSFEDFLSEN